MAKHSKAGMNSKHNSSNVDKALVNDRNAHLQSNANEHFGDAGMTNMQVKDNDTKDDKQPMMTNHTNVNAFSQISNNFVKPNKNHQKNPTSSNQNQNNDNNK